MSKKRNQATDITENSTVLSDPSKKETKAPKKGKAAKIIITCFVVAAVLFIGVPMLIVFILGGSKEDYTNNGAPTLTYGEMLASAEATDKSTELFGMKNPDLKDKAAVEELISTLRLEEKLGGYTVEVQSDTKPYNITLNFNLTHDEGDDAADQWNNTVIKYSTAILCLCDNVAQVNWQYPVNDGTDGAFFNRSDAEKFLNLGVAPSTLADSAQSVQLMLSLLGIDIY